MSVGSGQGPRIERIAGRALVLLLDDVDTDRIIPARFLKSITFEGLEAHVFEDDRAEAAARGTVHPFDDPARADAAVLIVGANFGCGSSREHAPRAIAQRGVRAVVGESFAEIFATNALAIGLACVAIPREALRELAGAVSADAGREVTVDLVAGAVRSGALTAPVALSPGAREALVSGQWDVTSLLLERYEEVDATRRRIEQAK